MQTHPDPHFSPSLKHGQYPRWHLVLTHVHDIFLLLGSCLSIYGIRNGLTEISSSSEKGEETVEKVGV